MLTKNRRFFGVTFSLRKGHKRRDSKMKVHEDLNNTYLEDFYTLITAFVNFELEFSLQGLKSH